MTCVGRDGAIVVQLQLQPRRHCVRPICTCDGSVLWWPLRIHCLFWLLKIYCLQSSSEHSQLQHRTDVKKKEAPGPRIPDFFRFVSILYSTLVLCLYIVIKCMTVIDFISYEDSPFKCPRMHRRALGPTSYHETLSSRAILYTIFSIKRRSKSVIMYDRVSANCRRCVALWVSVCLAISK